MLELAEKISTAICALVIAAVGGAYVLLGTPSAVPDEFVDPVRASPVPAKTSDVIAEKYPNRKRAEDAARALQKARSKLENELKKQVRRNYRIKSTQIMSVPSSTYEHISREATWMKQLKLYRGVPLKGKDGRNTRYQVSQIKDNTLLHKLGFRDGDTIELVDGEIMEFKEDSALEYRSRFRGALERLQNGESISVTVTRNGQPENLLFYLSD